jgi:hypothetical protein
MITNAYRPQSGLDKDIFMRRIATIKTLLDLQKSLIGGDFNIILTLEETSGGTKRLEQYNGKF